MKPLTKRRKLLLSIGLVILVLILVPSRTVFVPDYEIMVFGDSGQPLSGIQINQYFQDYSSGRSSDLSADALTDIHGHASFPSQSHWNSLGGIILGCASQILQTGAHASCGTYVDISVANPNLVETARNEQKLDDRPHHRSLKFTMKPCPSGDYWQCIGQPQR